MRTGDVQAVEDGPNLLEGLGHVEADVGHLVIGHLQDHWQHLLGGDFLPACFRQSLEHHRHRNMSHPSASAGLLTPGMGLTLMQNRVVILWR